MTITRPVTCSGWSLAGEIERGDLALGLVAVHAADHDHGRPGAVRDRDDRDHERDHWFDERGTRSVPNCFPSAVRSIVQETRVSLMPGGDSRGLLTIAL